MAAKCVHRWEVYGTALCPPVILLACQQCPSYKCLHDYTTEEWERLVFPPSPPSYPLTRRRPASNAGDA
jgi:hypothetical protein